MENPKTHLTISESEIDAIYSLVIYEIENGIVDKELWARCVAEEKGKDKKVKEQYIFLKAKKITEERLLLKNK